MANIYAFAPPPPPPPAASSYGPPSVSYSSQKPQQAQRGRGGFNSGFTRGSRGGGGRGGYGDSRGYGSGPRIGYSYAQRNAFQQSTNQSKSWQTTRPKPHPQPSVSAQASTNGHHHTGSRDQQTKTADQHGAKRSYNQAFPSKNTTSKMQTAPAVPSFGFQLPFATAPKKPEPVKDTVAAPQKRKLLGLIPLEDEGNASDEDEEAKLAAAHASSGAVISFSYKGKLATLRTADEIAAWIAERRKNFPTAARGEAMAKQKAEERVKALEKKQEAQKKILEAKKKKKQSRLTHGATLPMTKTGMDDSKLPAAKSVRKSSPPEPSLSKDQLKMERLRRTIAKNAKLLAKLEAANKAGQSLVSQLTESSDLAEKMDHGHLTDDSATSDSEVSSDDETSSSGSSTSGESDTSSNSELDSDSDLDEESAEETDKATNDALENTINDDILSDSDVPQELSSAQPANPEKTRARGKREDNRKLCRNLEQKGRCHKRGCKFRHKVKEGEIVRQTKHPAQKPAPRMSLYQRLLKQQIEEEEEQALQKNKADNGDLIAV